MCSTADLTRRLSDLEVELRALAFIHRDALRFDVKMKHDLGNALMLVSTFRELVADDATADLLHDAAEAIERARALVRPFQP